MKAPKCCIIAQLEEIIRLFTGAAEDDFKTAYVRKLAGFRRKDAVVYQGLIQSRNVGVVKTISGGKEV